MEFDLAGSHDIGNIWRFFAENARGVDDRYETIISKLDKAINEIADIDATGQTFRYPLDTESRKHLVEVGIINFAILKRKFTELEAALDELHRLNQYLRDEYLWGSFTKGLSRKNLFEIASLLPPRATWGEDSFDATKKAIKDRFGISSNELSKSINIIELHYELAPRIDMSIPLLGVEEGDINDFFRYWLEQHGWRSDEDLMNGHFTKWPSEKMLAAVVKNNETRAAVWASIKPKLTPERLAGVSALFYFACELEFSENYVRIYRDHLKEAEFLIAQSEGDVINKLFHLLDKSNALHNILMTLYFLNKNDLANKLVATHQLDERIPGLDEARTGVLFRKPEYWGYPE